MNGTDLLRAMSHVDEGYVHAAEEVQARRRAPMLLRWGALAACAAVAVTGAFLLRQPAPVEPLPTSAIDPSPWLTDFTPPDGPAVSDTPAPQLTDHIPSGGPAASGAPTPQLTVDLDALAVNELTDPLPGAVPLARFYLEHEEVEWDTETIAAWFGRTDLTPAFLPEGLTPAQEGSRATVWAKKENGEVAIDMLRFSAEDEDDERIFSRSLVLTASKNNPRPFRDWLHWNAAWETCEIAGVEATIVHAVYSYGPYDPETREPAGYYDWYDVDFDLDGLKYALTAQRLDLEEIVSVAASVITGGTDFTVAGGEGDVPQAEQ